MPTQVRKQSKYSTARWMLGLNPKLKPEIEQFSREMGYPSLPSTVANCINVAIRLHQQSPSAYAELVKS